MTKSPPQGGTGDAQDLPRTPVPDFYGGIRNQVPLFAAAGALSLLTGFIPFPHKHTGEVLVAGGLFFALTIIAVVLPWARLPHWLWIVVPIGYVAVVALLSDVQGGAFSGLSAIYFLPIVWLAYYGKRVYLIAGLLAVAAALTIPELLVGGPDYPAAQWRIVVVLIVGATLVAFTFMEMVNRDRHLVAEMAEQTLLVQQGARLAEAARERVTSVLRAATETAIVGSDASGVVTFFSAGAEKLLDCDASTVIARQNIFDIFDVRDGEGTRVTADSLHLLGTAPEDTRGSFVWTFAKRDGSIRRASAAVTHQHSDTPETSGFVIVASDITEREQLVVERERLLAAQNEVTQVLVEQNEQLRELTKMKDDVVATVSHEVRTPLTSIRGFIELILEGNVETLSEEQLHMLRTIDRNSLQLLQVADDLLDDPSLGRGLRVHFSEIDISQLAREAVEAMEKTASNGGVNLSVSAESKVVVFGDPSRLSQLYMNLISNAVKFTPPGGHVLVRVVSLGQFVRIDVMDDGPGIPVSERQNLFERFYRLASSTQMGIPGTGLGLAIAKSVVDAHSGTIQIVDTDDWSTTFRIHLPASA